MDEQIWSQQVSYAGEKKIMELRVIDEPRGKFVFTITDTLPGEEGYITSQVYPVSSKWVESLLRALQQYWPVELSNK